MHAMCYKTGVFDNKMYLYFVCLQINVIFVKSLIANT